MEYFKAFVKAWSADDANPAEVQRLGREALAEIDAEVYKLNERTQRLAREGGLIRQVMADAGLDAPFPMAPAATEPEPPAAPNPMPEPQGLSEAEKERIRAIWRETMAASGKDLTAAEILDQLTAENKWPLNVGSPGMAIGAVLRWVRKEHSDRSTPTVLAEGAA
jgi:hypothetical protein